MTGRAKLLLLLLLGFGGFIITFRLFMQTDYARRERAYFRNYPYQDMAARTKHRATISPVEIHHATGIKPAPHQDAVVKNIPPVAASMVVVAKNMVVHHRAVKKISLLPRQRVNRRPSKKRHMKKLSPKHLMPEKRRMKKIDASWRHAAEQGYRAYDQGDYLSAIRYFRRALRHAPENPALNEQLAYAYKKSGQQNKATETFKQTIDRYGKAAVPLRLKREMLQLQQRLVLTGYAIYRNKSSLTHDLGADLTRSQTAIAASYRPEYHFFNNLKIYGRLLAGMNVNQFRVDPDSYQAGIGLRLKPFSGHNLLLSAERLIRVGRFSRNDWMIRAGYSYDHGSGYRTDNSGWWRYNLYLDAAMIRPAHPDIFLTAQASGGYSMTVAPGFILQPRLTALATWQKDRFRRTTLLEAGPGVNLRYYFNDSTYQAYRSYIDLTVAYRLKISGTSTGGSGPVLTLLVHY